MNKKAIFIGLIIAIAGAAYYVSEKVAKSPITVVRRDIEVEKRNLEVLKYQTKLQYTTNAVVNEFKNNELILTIFVKDINSQISPLMGDNQYYCIMEYSQNGKQYQEAAEVELIDRTAYKDKTAYSMILDYSGSMFGYNHQKMPVEYLQDGANAFINNFAINDWAEIIKFGSGYSQIIGYTNDKAKLRNALYSDSYERGGTQLLEAVQAGINNLSRLDKWYFKSIIAFSDGDTEDSYMQSDVVRNALNNSIPIFTIGLTSGGMNEALMQQIADSTGGFYYFARNAQDLSHIYEVVSNNIKNSIVLKAKWSAEQVPPVGSSVTVSVKGVNSNTVVANWKTKLEIK